MRDAGAFRVLPQAYRHYELSHHHNFSIRYFRRGVSFFRFIVDALSSTPEGILIQCYQVFTQRFVRLFLLWKGLLRSINFT